MQIISLISGELSDNISVFWKLLNQFISRSEGEIPEIKTR